MVAASLREGLGVNWLAGPGCLLMLLGGTPLCSGRCVALPRPQTADGAPPGGALGGCPLITHAHLLKS